MAQERILIVDGDITLTEMLKSRLEVLGYLVDSTHNGNEALKVLESKWIDLIVLAVVLQSGMNGFQFFKEVKKRKEFSQTPIIVQTNKAAMKKMFEMMGAATFFIKPYSIDIFLDKIKDILSK